MGGPARPAGQSAIIDAEIVACREDGAPDFRALHSGNYSDEMLYAWSFDLMDLNGVDLAGRLKANRHSLLV